MDSSMLYTRSKRYLLSKKKVSVPIYSHLIDTSSQILC